MNPGQYRYDFHMIAWAISLWLSYCNCLGNVITTFIWLPGQYHYDFHITAWAISLQLSYNCLGDFITILWQVCVTEVWQEKFFLCGLCDHNDIIKLWQSVTRKWPLMVQQTQKEEVCHDMSRYVTYPLCHTFKWNIQVFIWKSQWNNLWK